MIMTKKKLLEKLWEEYNNFRPVLNETVWNDRELFEKLSSKYFRPEATAKFVQEYSSVRLAKNFVFQFCNTGEIMVACIIAGMVKPENCYGLETDPKLIKLARERLKPYGVPAENIKLINTDYDEFEKATKDFAKKMCEEGVSVFA